MATLPGKRGPKQHHVMPDQRITIEPLILIHAGIEVTRALITNSLSQYL